MKIDNFNVNSLMNTLMKFLNPWQHAFDILAINESKIDNQISSDEITFKIEIDLVEVWFFIFAIGFHLQI